MKSEELEKFKQLLTTYDHLLRLQKMQERTIETYRHNMWKAAKHFNRCPDDLSAEELKNYSRRGPSLRQKPPGGQAVQQRAALCGRKPSRHQGGARSMATAGAVRKILAYQPQGHPRRQGPSIQKVIQRLPSPLQSAAQFHHLAQQHRILSAGLLQRGQVIELQPQGGGGPFNVVPQSIEQVVRRHRQKQAVVVGVCPAPDSSSKGGDHHRNKQGSRHPAIHSDNKSQIPASQPGMPLGAYGLLVCQPWEYKTSKE
jgi:hypothetical protein